MTRREWTEKITTVRHVVGTFGRNRDTPPSLGQIREFVSLCEGLPDDTSVTVDKGQLDEGGRRLVTFSLRIVDKIEDTP